MATALLVLLAVALWPMGEGEAPPQPPSPRGVIVPTVVAPVPPPPPAPQERPSPPPVPASAVSDTEVLAAALHEEMVPLASSVAIEAIERDRRWVCAGEPLNLVARTGGLEPGAVFRWIWLTIEGNAGLHPGPSLRWVAPERAGTYSLRFQVCRDLGGRQVGVLAERSVEIEVRPCAPGERQEYEPLRLSVTQLGRGAFLFQAAYQGRARVETYAWDLGDGTTTTTLEPRLEHTYAVQKLGPQETRSFAVKLEARLAQGAPLVAKAFVATRGQPPPDEPPPVEVEVSRWSPQPDGGYRSELLVRSSTGDISWDRLERVTRLWDGGVEIDTWKWSEVIRVEQALEGGGFRGYALVSPAEVHPGIKQIHDFLYGYDANGQEVVVSWSPFKREPPAVPPRSEGPIRPAPATSSP